MCTLFFWGTKKQTQGEGGFVGFWGSFGDFFNFLFCFNCLSECDWVPWMLLSLAFRTIYLLYEQGRCWPLPDGPNQNRHSEEISWGYTLNKLLRDKQVHSVLIAIDRQIGMLAAVATHHTVSGNARMFSTCVRYATSCCWVAADRQRNCAAPSP